MKSVKSRGHLTVIAVMLVSFVFVVLTPLVHPRKAYAAQVLDATVSITAVDWAHLSVTITPQITQYPPQTKVYTDVDPTDGNHSYTKQGANKDGCFGEININGGGSADFNAQNNNIQKNYAQAYDTFSKGGPSQAVSETFMHAGEADINARIALFSKYKASSYDIDFKPTASSGCVGIGTRTVGGAIPTIIKDSDKLLNVLYFTDTNYNTIKSIVQPSWTFIRDDANGSPTQGKFLLQGDDDCKDMLDVEGNGYLAHIYQMTHGASDAKTPWVIRTLAPGCTTPTNIYQSGGTGKYDAGWGNLSITDHKPTNFFHVGVLPGPPEVDPPGVHPPGGDCGENGDCGGDANATCEAHVLNPLSWFLCPVFNGIADASDWLYSQFIIPFLKATPISTADTSENVPFKVWSGFRLYGNIILVVAVLIMVLGQAIGGGVVDAYTIKKVMPRILVAAILINLSIYIMAFMSDAVNIIGKGLQQLIWAPLVAAGGRGFSMSIAQSFGSVGVGLLATIFGAAGISGILLGILNGAFISKALIFILFAVVIPVLLAIAGVFAILIIRRGLLIFFVISSPIAFALYCLPNTEQYFRKWWDLYVRTLLVYPVVVLIFALADVLTVTILTANAGGDVKGLAGTAGGIIVIVTAFVIQFIPLAMVPFAFRFAGGVMGAIYTAAKGGRDRLNGLTKSRREEAQKDVKRQMITNRGRGYARLGALGDQAREGSLRRRGYRFLQNRVGGFNLHEAMAAETAEQIKRAEAQKDTGIDDEQRALTVDKAWAFAHDTPTGGTHWRQNADGTRSFRTLGGRWVSESDVDAAHQRWNGNVPMLQWSLAYEMQKATTQEERDYLKDNVGRLQESQHLTDGEMSGIWTGAAFMKQNTDREYKQQYWDGNTHQITVSGLGLLREVDERQGSWQMAAQAADTWTTMSQEIQRARNVIATNAAAPPGATPYADGEMDLEAAQEVMQRGARIARSLESGYQDEHGVYHSSVGQGASGRTREEMEAFAAMFSPDDYTREYGSERSRTGRPSGDAPQPGVIEPRTPPPSPPHPPTRRARGS